MLVGHFAASFVGKRIAPKVSLGTLVLASLLPDLLWCVFLLAGIEHVQIKQGRGAANYLVPLDIPLSHSLLMDAGWAALVGGMYFLWRRYPRGSWALLAVVLSHWLLDIVTNRDMPPAPGFNKSVGFGLWSSVPGSLIVEGGLWLAGIILYVRATHPKQRAGVYAFWIVAALLTLVWYSNIAGPPPPSVVAMGISSLIFFSLTVAWAYWMNRLRPAES